MTGVTSADPELRSAIRAELLAINTRKQPINRGAIKAKYTEQKPQQAQYINQIVTSYAEHLERKKRKRGKRGKRSGSQPSNAQSAFSDTVPAPEIPSPYTAAQQATSQTSYTFRQTTVRTSHTSGGPASPAAAMPDIGNYDAQKSRDDRTYPTADSNYVKIVSKDGSRSQENNSLQAAMLNLDDQLEFLTSDDEDEEMTGCPLSNDLEHAVLISAALEKSGHMLPSQFALMGKLKLPYNPETTPDARVMLNTNVPFSAFICGLQGSGKSHTTSCIIENCSMGLPALGKLEQSVSTLVLNFNEYSSSVNSQPTEAAFLASVLPKYASQQQRLPVRVLVSPTNYHNLTRMYSQIPHVEVRAFRLNPQHLNIGMMLSLMSMSQSSGMPLYMAQVLKLLRDMVIERGGHFDYCDFRSRLQKLRLERAQTPFLAQRLDLLDSYLDLRGVQDGDYFVAGGVTVLDLSCPFVDQSTACILFRIAIDLFLYAHPSRGKMIVADEAHKYMTDTAAAKELTETFLTIIRQQRHLGVRTIISTQEPTISPRLIDLCSITFIHRFTSPEWYNVLKSHIPIDKGNGNSYYAMQEGLYRIANLGTGEALVFAQSAKLVDEDENDLDAKHEVFRMKVRKRITWDGGRTIVCIR
ncbi:hypothetical protein BJY00DRAFT_325432 [Aspergillus carlsbadensis]|nr:hypothetical protein BJY00DRAFT_325432 [Aspergillus carlsbadensis]